MTKKQFAEICRKAGVEFEITENTLRVDPPSGFVLKDSGLHYRDIYLNGWHMRDAYADMARDLEGGIEKCEVKDCDFCWSE